MIAEDLPQMASALFDLAITRCGDCRDYHATWGYLRAAGVRRGAAADLPTLAPRLASLPGAPRVLLVGSADTGQLTLVANALAGRDPRIAVLDRCPSPLALCADFAARHGLRLDLRQEDCESLADVERFDLILLHEFIGFFEPSRRLALLARLRQALVPGGRLAVAQRIAPAHAAETRQGGTLADRAIAALADRAIALPESRDRFAARLAAELDGAARRKRNQAFAAPDAIAALLQEVGFVGITAEEIVLDPAAERDLLPHRPPIRRCLFFANRPAAAASQPSGGSS